jgi:TetR/AcrR family tetracycline transcriptional repressor
VVDGLEESPGIELISAEGWQSYLQRLAHGVRAMAHGHPEVFPLIATRHPAAPWLRPPLRSLRIVDAFLRGLKRHGFSDEGAVAAYRAFSSFLLGHLLLEVAARGVDTAPDEPLDEGDPDDSGSAAVLAEHPELSRLESLLSEDHADAEFEQSLENLLDRLERFLVLE